MLTRLLGTTGLTVSELGLGTVAIGLPYGIGVKELPSEAETKRILKTAVELGITYIDTARGYGVAEERIGKSGIGRLPGVVIGTKCAQFLKQEPNLTGKELEARLRQDIDTSRKNLQQDMLQLVQLHMELPDYTDFRELVEIMQQLKDEGKVAHVGVSTRGEAAPLAALESRFFETMQLAYSILDQRLAPRVLPATRENKVGVICRSVLLQGALSPTVEKLPEQLSPLKENSRRAAAVASELGIDLPTLALRFVISNPAISTALIGTVTPAHLETAIAALAAGPLPQDILEQLYSLAMADPNQVDPGTWPKSS